MLLLTNDSFLKVRTYLSENGRTLDWNLFLFHFESGSAEPVLSELSKFQNADGGFRLLEPDLTTDTSSAITSTLGFQILREVSAQSGNPVVQRGIKYFLDTLDSEKLVWPIIPPETNDAPHAPWWDYPKSAEIFENFLANPRAEVLGYLWEYSDLVPQDSLQSLSAALSDHLKTLPEKLDMNDTICFTRLIESPNLPEELRDTVIEKLIAAVPSSVDTDPADWLTHSLKPLWTCPSPESTLSEMLSEDLDKNLDFEIENQSPDGFWKPAWSWAGLFPEAWEHARAEWQSILTLNTLKSLYRYNRIEGLTL